MCVCMCVCVCVCDIMLYNNLEKCIIKLDTQERYFIAEK